MKKTAVVVLGEVGRSPRSRYHAESLAKRGLVYLIGYGDPATGFPRHPRVTAAPMTDYPPAAARRLPALLTYLVKTIWQAIDLTLLLVAGGRLDAVLCQCPPAIPTLAVCWLYCLITGAKFVVDWHNYAHSLMALAHGERAPIVRLARRVEFFFGSRAHAAFCVSRAMKEDLFEEHNIGAKLLYDRPPDRFAPISPDERRRFLADMSREYAAFEAFSGDGPPPALLFSSTSWTPDEDFAPLLDALERYDDAALADRSQLPDLVCVVTGRGPEKRRYEALLAQKKLRRVRTVTPWLEADDYPKMVASADLGVCLHKSSSGLDLPMKIVDMFGCGVPVCAYRYPCISEVVRENENGHLFSDGEELASHLIKRFKNFPNDAEQNEIAAKYKRNLAEYQTLRWENNWDNRVRSVFD